MVIFDGGCGGGADVTSARPLFPADLNQLKGTGAPLADSSFHFWKITIIMIMITPVGFLMPGYEHFESGLLTDASISWANDSGQPMRHDVIIATTSIPTLPFIKSPKPPKSTSD